MEPFKIKDLKKVILPFGMLSIFLFILIPFFLSLLINSNEGNSDILNCIYYHCTDGIGYDSLMKVLWMAIALEFVVIYIFIRKNETKTVLLTYLLLVVTSLNSFIFYDFNRLLVKSFIGESSHVYSVSYLTQNLSLEKMMLTYFLPFIFLIMIFKIMINKEKIWIFNNFEKRDEIVKTIERNKKENFFMPFIYWLIVAIIVPLIIFSLYPNIYEFPDSCGGLPFCSTTLDASPLGLISFIAVCIEFILAYFISRNYGMATSIVTFIFIQASFLIKFMLFIIMAADQNITSLVDINYLFFGRSLQYQGTIFGIVATFAIPTLLGLILGKKIKQD